MRAQGRIADGSAAQAIVADVSVVGWDDHPESAFLVPR